MFAPILMLAIISTEIAIIGCDVEASCERNKDLDKCLEEISHLMPEDRGLPFTEQKVDNYCISFQRGMNCVDSYTSRCLTPERREEFEYKMNLKTQRAFMDFLCHDRIFRATYLSHKDCLESISDDWYICYDKLNTILDYQAQNHLVDVRSNVGNACCLREIFYHCIYSKSYKKCNKEAALFLRKVTATLLYGDSHFEKCKNYTMEKCSNGEATTHSRHKASIRIIPMFFIVLLTNNNLLELG